MRFKKRHLIYFIIVLVISSFLSTFQLPYYIYKPGGADALTSIVEVDNGFESEGEMHLVTVNGGQATPIQYIGAKLFSYHDILPIEDVRPKDMTNEEYIQAQLQMMEGSQESS